VGLKKPGVDPENVNIRSLLLSTSSLYFWFLRWLPEGTRASQHVLVSLVIGSAAVLRICSCP
jgi:hypothetical protein